VEPRYLSHFFEPVFADGVDPCFELASHMGWRRTKFFLRAPAQSDSAYHHCTLVWGTRKHARLASLGMRVNQASHVPAFVGLNSTT
jgi:hypothetical protein